MANRWSLQREANRANRARNVRTVSFYSPKTFWANAAGNFLITGGTTRDRNEALAEKLCGEMRKKAPSVIVLTSSDDLRNIMISKVSRNEGGGGKLYVFSSRYRNYHPMYSWEQSNILLFLTRAANLLGYGNTNDLTSYAAAFLDILRHYYPFSLSSIVALCGHPDGHIVTIGQNAGAAPDSLDYIRSHPDAGTLFRKLIQQIGDNFRFLTTPQCATRFSLSAVELLPGNVCLIDMRSDVSSLMNAYFAMELDLALARRRPFSLVLSDISAQREDFLLQTFEKAQMWNRETGVSALNANALIRTERESESPEHSHYPTRMILTSDGFSDAELETHLRSLGVYRRHEVQTGGGRAPGLFRFLTDTRWELVTDNQHLRVDVEDTRHYAAVLSSNSEIILARRLFR